MPARPVRYAALAVGGAALLLVPCAVPVWSQARLAVLAEPAGTAVGVAVVINAGNAWESASEAGLGRLAAESVIEEFRPQLDALGGRATAACDATTIRFSLLLAPATWRVATGLFLETLFERTVSDAAVQRAKGALLEAVQTEAQTAVAEVRAALGRARFGRTSRWARPPCGRVETLAELETEDVRRMARTRFLPTRATAAVAGPVDTTAAWTALRRWLSDSNLPVLIPAPEPAPASTEHIERSTVTTWVSLAFPFDGDADTEALRMLAFRIAEATAPAATRPDVFDAAADIERHGGGGALVVHLVAAPERARHWADSVRALIRHAGTEALDPPAFQALRDRYRGERLLALATPESRAMDAALQLFFGHGFRPPADRVAALGTQRLRRAAATLEPPATATLGPRIRSP